MVNVIDTYWPIIITINAIADPKNADIKKNLLEILQQIAVPISAPPRQNTS